MLAGDTPIEMADGSRKRLREMAAGDLVRQHSDHGTTPAVVSAVFLRANRRPILIQYGAGHVLTIDSNAWLRLADRGRLRARDVRSGDALDGVDGSLRVLGVFPPAAGKRNGVNTVYGILTEAEAWYAAKGVFVLSGAPG